MKIKKLQIKNNNLGTSLIELIIVVAILGILTGVSAITYNVIKNADVTKSEKNITSCYGKLRTYTMSQMGNWRFSINQKEGMYYGGIYEGDEKKGNLYELGRYVEIFFKDENGTEKKIDSANELNITLKTSTGGVNNITYGNAVVYDSSRDTSSYGEIIIKRNSRETVIKIYYVTGKTITN